MDSEWMNKMIACRAWPHQTSHVHVNQIMFTASNNKAITLLSTMRFTNYGLHKASS